jgi:hypothetical protein
MSAFEKAETIEIPKEGKTLQEFFDSEEFNALLPLMHTIQLRLQKGKIPFPPTEKISLGRTTDKQEKKDAILSVLHNHAHNCMADYMMPQKNMEPYLKGEKGERVISPEKRIGYITDIMHVKIVGATTTQMTEDFKNL